MQPGKLAGAIRNIDLVARLWRLGPHRDLRQTLANSFGDREVLRCAMEMAGRIDRIALEALAVKYPYSGRDATSAKYLCTGAHMARAVFNAQLVGFEPDLEATVDVQRVLDIGTGAGYFPFVLGQLGHTAHAIDLGDVSLYNDLVELLDVHRTVHRVTRAEPLPQTDEKYDVITAFQVIFDHDPEVDGGYWRVPEWEAFLNTLKAEHLSPGGRVFIGLNSGLSVQLLKDLDALFLSRGGERYPNGYLLTEL